MTDDQRDLVRPVDEPQAPVRSPAGGKRKSSWRQLMTIVVAAIVLMLLAKAFVVQVYRIPSASMETPCSPATGCW